MSYSQTELEQDIANWQIAAKDADNHIWFITCNRLLHKYNLPYIYT